MRIVVVLLKIITDRVNNTGGTSQIFQTSAFLALSVWAFKTYLYLLSQNLALNSLSFTTMHVSDGAIACVTGPFKDFPQVTVYHPTSGNAFANIGWTGWIGSITGERHMWLILVYLMSYLLLLLFSFFVSLFPFSERWEEGSRNNTI